SSPPLSDEIFVFVHDSHLAGWAHPQIGRADSNSIGLFGSGFARLDFYILALVANTLAFVWFRLSQRSQLGRELAYLLLVGALNHDVCRIRAGHSEPGWNIAN